MAPPDATARTLTARAHDAPQPPAWAAFPSERLWTLAHLVQPFTPRPGANGRVLFVTANLNAGGAQRSLVNLAARHGNPRCDPLRPWGHAPLGIYRLLAQGEAPAGCDIEYGRHLLVFQPASGQALEAESFGRLLLLVYAGPTSTGGRMRPTQGGLRLEQTTFETLLAALATDAEAVLQIDVLRPPAWWQFWKRTAPTLPIAADAPKLSAPPVDEASLATLIAGGRRLARDTRPQSSDDWSSSGTGTSSSSRSSSNGTDDYSGHGGSFGGAGASGGWDAAASGGRGVDATGRIVTAATGAALLAGSLDAAESGESSQVSDDTTGGNAGTDTGTNY